MICTTVSFQSCFCWLYRASPSFEPKDKMCISSALHCYSQAIVPSMFYLETPNFEVHSSTLSLWQSCPLISFKTLATESLSPLQYYSLHNLWWFQYTASSTLPCLGLFRLIPLLQSPVFYPPQPPTPTVTPYSVSKQGIGAEQFFHVQGYPAQWKTFSVSGPCPLTVSSNLYP